MSDDALSLWVVMARAHEAVSARLSEDAHRHDLTLAEFGVLEALYHLGPLHLGELGRKVLVSSGGVTFLVDGLQKRGLLVRKPCPRDRRARLAELTEDGRALIQRAFPAHADLVAALFGRLTSDEMNTTTDALRRVGLAAEKMTC